MRVHQFSGSVQTASKKYLLCTVSGGREIRIRRSQCTEGLLPGDSIDELKLLPRRKKINKPYVHDIYYYDALTDDQLHREEAEKINARFAKKLSGGKIDMRAAAMIERMNDPDIVSEVRRKLLSHMICDLKIIKEKKEKKS